MSKSSYEEALEALDKIKEALNPYGYYDDLYDTIKYSLLRLRSLEKFKATFDNYELVKKQDFIALKI